MKDIVYIVVLKDEYKKCLELTTIDKKFCGRYIKSEYKNVYFELNGSHGIVVIPEEWIEFMAPSKLCNDTKKIEEPDLRLIKDGYKAFLYRGEIVCLSKISLEKLTELCNDTSKRLKELW